MAIQELRNAMHVKEGVFGSSYFSVTKVYVISVTKGWWMSGTRAFCDTWMAPTVYAYMYVCMHVRLYVLCMYTYVCVYVCVCMRMYSCMCMYFVCMHACVCPVYKKNVYVHIYDI